MGVARGLTNWNVRQRPIDDAFWGPVTSSIDWCEANYDVSRHVAEFVNTLSNIPFLLAASWGIYSGIQNDIPPYLLLPFVGLAMVGTGSFAFHATLSYEMQLMDELPMLFAATLTAYCIFNTQKPGQPQPIPWIGLWLFLMVTSVCIAYILHPDPVLHQVAFASIMIITAIRSRWIAQTQLQGSEFSKHRRQEIARQQRIGVAFFVGAFSIWLVDCFACGPLTDLKLRVGKPWSFLLELHAWWHIGTGLGGYWLGTNMQMLVLSVQEDPRLFEYRSTLGGLLPYVKRRSRPFAKGETKKE